MSILTYQSILSGNVVLHSLVIQLTQSHLSMRILICSILDAYTGCRIFFLNIAYIYGDNKAWLQYYTFVPLKKCFQKFHISSYGKFNGNNFLLSFTSRNSPSITLCPAFIHFFTESLPLHRAPSLSSELNGSGKKLLNVVNFSPKNDFILGLLIEFIAWTRNRFYLHSFKF